MVFCDADHCLCGVCLDHVLLLLLTLLSVVDQIFLRTPVAACLLSRFVTIILLLDLFLCLGDYLVRQALHQRI